MKPFWAGCLSQSQRRGQGTRYTKTGIEARWQTCYDGFMEIKQKTKQEVLAIADDLEEKARTEEIESVTFFDLRGKVLVVDRYRLPKIVEELRIKAGFME